MDEEIIDSSIDTVPKSKTIPSICKICGASALYKYFGVVSCHACKIFFKRNAQTGLQAFQCNSVGSCEINVNNRHICTLCRLRKCFASGMQIEMIRCSRKTNRNISRSTKRITTNEQNQSDMVPISNLIHLDHNELNTDQWDLLLNLIHCYEEYNILSHVQQFIQEQTSLPIKLRFKTTSLDTLFGSILIGIELFFKLNKSYLSLCSHDRSILLRCAMGNAGSFTAALVLREVLFIHYPDVTQSIENNLINLTKHLPNEIVRDRIFLKLGIVMFVFSTTNCATYTNIGLDYLENIKDILQIQDMYAEIAWKYLLYKYGHTQAVVCFTNLIKSFLVINTAISAIHQLEQHKRMVENLIEKINQQFTVGR